MISKDTIARILDTARVEEVVADFVSLKKRGSNYIGLCPFHNEKTPSFNVNPARGIFKCFGCGKAGSAVGFIMEYEKMTYPEALKFLARKYNIEVEETLPSPEDIQIENEKEALFVACSFAQKYFTEQLHSSENGKAIGLSYFKERGFSQETIEKFQLGYSHDEWRGFTEAALAAGYKIENLVKTGLTIRSDKENADEKHRYFDRFSGRVMFPIHTASGRVIAFGGRTLKTDKKLAKYINSPETDIYHKSNVLYGLFFAKKEIIGQDNCFLVEGYTDVISLHQAGLENVVASSGTSLTVEQIRAIRRYTNNITILYDGDSAGIKASFRGIDLILEEGMNVKVLLFPGGEDPDSFSRKVSGQELKDFIRGNSRDFISFKTDILFKDVRDDPIRRAEFIKELIQSIALIPDRITRTVYVQSCARQTQMKEEVLINELNRLRKKQFEKKDEAAQELQVPVYQAGQQAEVDLSDCEQQEKEIIRILLNFGKEIIRVGSEDKIGAGEKIIPASTVHEISVAEYMVHDLTSDSFEFENPDYRKIFIVYAQAIGRQEVPDIDLFTLHTDAGINRTAVHLLSELHPLSDWSKKDIFVVPEQKRLNEICEKAILTFKMKKISKIITENQKKIQQMEGDDAIIQLMNENKNLNRVKKFLSDKLGRVIAH